MPDFERVIRGIDLLYAKDPAHRDRILAFYKGVDHARWEIVKVFTVLAIFWVVVNLISNPYGL